MARFLGFLGILTVLIPAGVFISTAWSAPAAITPAPSLQEFSGMVGIPPGRFRMGLSLREINKIMKWCERADKHCSRWWFKDAFPAHSVILDAYWIDRYEVTNKDYLEFVKATGHRPALDETCTTKGCRSGNLWTGRAFPPAIAKQPVTQVDWHDAQAYCQWRQKRLPTEAEWEKAARGPVGNLFPWGNDMPPGRATYRRKWRGVFTMTNVGSHPSGASIYGVHDLAGNAWEWVADWYDKDYYSRHPKKNPKGPATGQFKTLRGGSWVNNEDTLVSAFRRWSRPKVRFNDTGFRCARDPLP
ncbi:MAG: formylglycine-generating enzyme family protein [Nitrospinaceae bacterium]